MDLLSQVNSVTTKSIDFGKLSIKPETKINTVLKNDYGEVISGYDSTAHSGVRKRLQKNKIDIRGISDNKSLTQKIIDEASTKAISIGSKKLVLLKVSDSKQGNALMVLDVEKLKAELKPEPAKVQGNKKKTTSK